MLTFVVASGARRAARIDRATTRRNDYAEEKQRFRQELEARLLELDDPRVAEVQHSLPAPIDALGSSAGARDSAAASTASVRLVQLPTPVACFGMRCKELDDIALVDRDPVAAEVSASLASWLLDSDDRVALVDLRWVANVHVAAGDTSLDGSFRTLIRLNPEYFEVARATARGVSDGVVRSKGLRLVVAAHEFGHVMDILRKRNPSAVFARDNALTAENDDHRRELWADGVAGCAWVRTRIGDIGAGESLFRAVFGLLNVQRTPSHPALETRVLAFKAGLRLCATRVNLPGFGT